MTEQEWLSCTEPSLMLDFLRGKTSGRKLRLFATRSAAKERLASGREQAASPSVLLFRNPIQEELLL